MKETIVHIIDSLGRGGAETMLVGLLPQLNERYNVVLVTLSGKNDFGDIATSCHKKYRLNFNGWKDLYGAVRQLKKIIKKEKPVLVRTDLFVSSIIGRLATPSNIPLVFAVHSMLGFDAFEKSRLSLLLEKWVYKKRHSILAVSSAVLEDYEKHVGIKGKNYVLNNFVDAAFFDPQYRFHSHKQPGKLKLVAVGNLKEAKNYGFLLEAVRLVKDAINIELTIIGEGYLRPYLEKRIGEENLPVNLLGMQQHIYKSLESYDAYIMCSLHEGFGNGAAEAMATGLPLILNDTATMKEMSRGNAIFFPDNDVNALANILSAITTDQLPIAYLSETGRDIAQKNYSQQAHFNQLTAIYTAIQKPAGQ